MKIGARWRWALHVAIAAGVLALVFRHLGWREILGHLREIRPAFAAMVLLLTLADGAVRIWNWQQLLRGLGLRPPHMYRRLTACYHSGGFLGTAMPSTMSTDALRAVMAASALGGHVAFHTGPLVALNVLGLSAGCTIGSIGLVFVWASGRAPAFALFVAPVIAGVLLACLLAYGLLKFRRDVLITLLRIPNRRWFWLRRIARKFIRGLSVFSARGSGVLPIFAVALLTQAIHALGLLVAAEAVGVHLPLYVWMLIAPLTTIAALLPLSVAGYGGDQVALVYLLAPFGVASTQAVAASLTAATLWLVSTLTFGGLIFLATSRFLRLPRTIGDEPNPS